MFPTSCNFSFLLLTVLFITGCLQLSENRFLDDILRTFNQSSFRFSISSQVQENKLLHGKVTEVDDLKRQLLVAQESESVVEKLRRRVAELESEVVEVRHVLEDAQSEAKIVLESMEKENKSKDEVKAFVRKPQCGFFCITAHFRRS